MNKGRIHKNGAITKDVRVSEDEGHKLSFHEALLPTPLGLNLPIQIRKPLVRCDERLDRGKPLLYSEGKRIMTYLLIVFFVTSLNVWAQRVKDFVVIEGARSNELSGVGLVVGLNGTGDNDDFAKMMLARYYERKDGIKVDPKLLASKNVAWVKVTATLPPFQSMGTHIDVSVLSLHAAKSLKGGYLTSVFLYGPQMKKETSTPYALAEGYLIINGEGSNGMSTTAYIPRGARMEREITTHNFVKVRANGRKYIKLNLDKTDFSLVKDIVDAINSTDILMGTSDEYDEGRQLNIAKGMDGGKIEVDIPTEKELNGSADFVSDPVRFVSKILEINVRIVSVEKSMVLINPTTKVIAITGDVTIKPGWVERGRISFRIPNEMSLYQFFDELRKDTAGQDIITAQDKIDFIRELDRLGLIKGIVISK